MHVYVYSLYDVRTSKMGLLINYKYSYDTKLNLSFSIYIFIYIYISINITAFTHNLSTKQNIHNFLSFERYLQPVSFIYIVL